MAQRTAVLAVRQDCSLTPTSGFWCRVVVTVLAAILPAACTKMAQAPDALLRAGRVPASPGATPAPTAQLQWQIMQQNLPGALMSVWGTSPRHIYAVGADANEGQGPYVFRYNGSAWNRLSTAATGDLWWVYGVTSDQIYMAGSKGLILRYAPPSAGTGTLGFDVRQGAAGTFTRLPTPRADITLFGIWGAAANDVWAVGGDIENKGGPQAVIWHFDGSDWSEAPVPGGSGTPTPFKVWGTARDDVWICGFDGLVLHFDGQAWSRVASGTTRRLLTIHGAGRLVEAVGGFGDAEMVEARTDSGFSRVAPRIPALMGVFLTRDLTGAAVGLRGTVLMRTNAGWSTEITQAPTDLDLHAVWVDTAGGLWTVGGRVLSGPLTNGILLHLPPPAAPAASVAGCSPARGVICTFAGTGVRGFNGDGKPLLESALYTPIDLEFDAENTAYIVDWSNHRIRVVTAAGTLQTVVGTDTLGDGPDDRSDRSAPGAPGSTVNLNHPTDILFDPTGLMVIDNWHNHKIRTWNPATGLTRVLAGSNLGFSGDGGPATAALLDQPSRILLDPAGNLFIVDMRNQRLRKIVPDTTRTITTVAGTGTKGFNGDGLAPLATQFALPSGGNPLPAGALAMDVAGKLYLADIENHRIRVIDFTANTVRTLAGTGTPGFGGDNGPATAAQLNSPADIEIGPEGNLYIADSSNHRIRAVDLQTGVIRTVAGTGSQGFSGDNGPATSAQLSLPFGIAFDRAGNLYIADTFNSRIREVGR